MNAKTASMRLCLKCGAKIFAGAEFCGACLLENGLALSPEDEVDLGQMAEFGDYELIEEIGRGGQGVVYRARQKSLNRTVALKVVGLGRWASTPHLKRFRQEAEAAARLEHPQIVPIYEIGEWEGSCYYSMKFVEGGQLDEVVRRDPMSPRRAAELLVKTARTVQFAHEHGILHRDIKPGNILLDRQGEPHLTDFGLARLIEQESTVTNSFDVLGTPSYMAPEQAAGHARELTAAADIYSLGAVFYQMLTGQPPFAGGTTYETIRLVLETEPRNPRLWNSKVDIDLATICLKCLEKDPKKRYKTAEELAQDVERWLRHEPIRARPIGAIARGYKWIRRNPATMVLAGSLAALAMAIGVIIWNSGWVGNMPINGIAVLPFENLSGDQENAYFADGVQDDILTKLAKVAALKVISRTSVMQYRGARNIPEIANALRVSHVLVGSVRRSASRIHLNTQLINTRTNAHVWAEEFDRDLIDTFTIQSEVAQKVAEQLHATVTPAEKQSIARRPTADLTAFDLYTRGKNRFLRVSYSNQSKEDLLEAANLLNQAVTRDPSFFQAYCQLVWVHDFFYVVGHDHTPARLAMAEAALQSALRLQPDAGEAHLTRAENLYNGHLDYEGALAELEVARQRLPNEPRVFELRGYIERRQGKHEECLRSLQRAVEIDPRNLFTLQQIANSCILLQRFADAKTTLERALSFEPDDPDTKGASAWIDLEWKADIRPLHQMMDTMRASHSIPLSRIADGLLICGLMERNAAAAREALIVTEQNTPLNDQAVHFNRSFLEGVVARMEKNEGKALAAFKAARAEQEQVVQAQPNYAPALCILGLIDAALGRKEEALNEGRRALELAPVEKDALNGPLMEKYLAMIAAWTGEKDLACEQLAAAIRHRGTINYGYLKLLPLWDPLRGDPGFEKILASLAPK
jgi:TolB-like protein/Tfp pilus assembly protein PilF/predicted Ser/Thr protein kinase